jgi:polyhydroxyalkanoate synthase
VGGLDAWIAERAGAKRMPPATGSTAHPVLEDAPGNYVLRG